MTETAAEKTGSAKPCCILFVEDDPNDFRIASQQLAKLNVANPTYCVRSAEELTRYLEGKGEYAYRDLYPFPGLIVMDMRLPGADGLQAQAFIRSTLKYRKIPIIVTSSAEQLRALRSAVMLGAQGFILKPFKAERFAQLAKDYRFPIEYRAS